MAGRLQVALGPARDQPLVAGIPAVLRAAQVVAEDLAPERIVLIDADPGFARRWRRQLSGLNGIRIECPDPPSRDLLDFRNPGITLLMLSSDGIPQSGALERFVSAARDADRPPSESRWTREGKLLANYFPSFISNAAGRTPDVRDHEAAPDDWIDLKEPGAVARAEQALFDGLSQDTDGYIAHFDRRISVALSRLLLKTPVTPNHVTTASLVLGLLGAAWLAFGSYPFQILGTLLLWFCCILDGCDGEVARLKLLCSRSGANYDLGADHIAHLAIFLAVPFAVRTANPQAQILLPGALMVSGLAACMATVWWLILRRPKKHPDRLQLFFERIASRDYIYAILILVVVKKLHWFLWAAAFGTHFCNLAFWWVFLRRPEPLEPGPAS